MTPPFPGVTEAPVRSATPVADRAAPRDSPDRTLPHAPSRKEVEPLLGDMFLNPQVKEHRPAGDTRVMDEVVRPVEVEPGWTFLTNHAHVLLCLAQNSEARMRDVAARVGITERAVQRIVAELEEAGYIERQRSGRRNSYRIHRHLPLRHPIERHRSIACLLDLVLQEEASPAEP